MSINTDFQLQALKDFATAENKILEERLEQILDDVGTTGQYIFPWHFMKPLYAYKLDKVTAEFLEATPPMHVDGTQNLQEIEKLKEFRQELLQSFDKFSCAPFTLQRVTELLNHPKRHYKSTAKFFRGLEKNIMVVSTMEMVTPEERNLLKRQRKDSLLTDENGMSQIRPLIKRPASAGIVLNGTITNVETNIDTDDCHNDIPQSESQPEEANPLQISKTTIEPEEKQTTEYQPQHQPEVEEDLVVSSA